jgi:predicted RNase H-like nuclease (RuvC/YqgF family)
MAMFAKKVDGDSKLGMDAAVLPATTSASPRSGYGIAETIQLMRELPGDQNAELVVRVVRATLASLNVRLPDIIDDAAHKQKTIQDRIEAVHGTIADLEKQLQAQRAEIATLEADLAETTSVKERLQAAERTALPPASLAHGKAMNTTLLGGAMAP